MITLPTEGRAGLIERAANLVYRIEAAGALEYESGNFERWKADARELAPLLRQALQAVEQQGAVMPPPGYVLVPVEPTEAMKIAGIDAYFDSQDDPTEAELYALIWSAMISSRPSNEGGE